jgi:hypothetical protein
MNINTFHLTMKMCSFLVRFLPSNEIQCSLTCTVGRDNRERTAKVEKKRVLGEEKNGRKFAFCGESAFLFEFFVRIFLVRFFSSIFLVRFLV